MRNILIKFLSIALLLVAIELKSEENQYSKIDITIDKVQALKDSLTEMMKQTDNAMFVNHCKSFLKVIDAQSKLTLHDSMLLSATYDTFCRRIDTSSCLKMSSYLNRQWPFIIAWKSPTDGVISLATLTLPKGWNPDSTYPLYIHLHGLSSNYALPVDHLTRFFIKGASTTYAYDDGYWLAPWGRGNLWYQGISETDVWECKAELERLVKIEQKRQYLTGHSMGGYGSWYIASRSAGVWAALGVEAGALQYGNNNLVNNEVAQQLKDLPTYFVVGTNDGLHDIDKQAYDLLTAAGNPNTKFVTFTGAHEHLYSNDENMYLWMQDFVNDDYYDRVVNVELKNLNDITCYPNPFSENFTVSYKVRNGESISIKILDYTGKETTLPRKQMKTPGVHSLTLNGGHLKPGIYFVSLSANGGTFYKKIVRY